VVRRAVGHAERMTRAYRDPTLHRIADSRLRRGLAALGAVLTGVALLLLSLLPRVPSETDAIPSWIEGGTSLLSWSDEVLFFAVVAWGAGAVGLFGPRSAARSARIHVGMTALAIALVALVVLLLALGRLVYPVFEIALSAETAALVVSTAFGALHLAYLGFAVAAVALGWSTRAGLVGRAVGILAAAAFIAGSFPWLTPSWWNSSVAVLVAVWGVSLAVTTGASSDDDGTS
jgi:hypothetical protein